MKIFDVENNKVILTAECLLIPEFKVLVDKFKKNPIPVLSYVEFMCNPTSPYAYLPEADKSENIAKDMGVTVSLDDEDINVALKKANDLYLTPTRRFYLNAKEGLENMGDYLAKTKLTSGREGSDSAIMSGLKSVGTITEQFQKLEKTYKEEVANLRGSQSASYDERP
jgi:hypothetical protein